MDFKTKKEITVELSKDDLAEVIEYYFSIFRADETRGFEISKITDRTKTEVIQGADPHDADYVEHFDGVKVTLN